MPSASSLDTLPPEPSGWKTLLSSANISKFTNDGSWANHTVANCLELLTHKESMGFQVIDPTAGTLTARTLRIQALRLAQSLAARGVVRGDVVSVQLPNWYEAIIIDLACAYGGFVCNPIVSIYREAEVEFIIRDCGARVLFVPDTFRRFNYRQMSANVQGRSSKLRDVFIVRPIKSCENDFNGMVSGDTSVAIPPGPNPNHVKLLMYTSGTTRTPKGVLHTHNTIGAEVANVIEWLKLDAKDVILMPSPLGHITGYLYGIQMPITLGCAVVLMESWNAEEAATLIERFSVTFTVGATPFLRELVSVSTESGRRLPSLRYFPTGGAPVPPEAIYAADRAFERCIAFRIYGSTEAPTITLGIPDREQIRQRANTEGRVVGHDVRLIDGQGHTVASDQEGEVTTRGPELCVGYLRETDTVEAFDADGFFHTGDLAIRTNNGCLTITGRKKDIIIRGGENISPKEIEDALCEHPAVRDAAVVAMPHSRLGETACAYVSLKADAQFDFLAMTQLLESKGLARQKFPERLEVVPELPYTPAGKVQKNILRNRIKQTLSALAPHVPES